MAAETDTLIKGIIAIIVLFVVALVIYSVMNFDTVKQIAQEVFHVDTKEQINSKTEDSVSDFSSELDFCVDGNYNPNNKNNCFCFQKGYGYIQEGSYISIQKIQSASKFTTLTENGAPLSQFTKSFNLGLMATQKTNDGYQLGCVFPDQYYIISENDQWYIKWIDEKLKDWIPFDEDYIFGFYSEETSDQLAYPSLFRLDSTHYCLITELVEEPIEYSSSSFISFNPTKSLAPALMRVGDDPRVFNEPSTPDSDFDSYFSYVNSFLLNDKLYCNKL